MKKGQWIAEGAMWVEPDTNMTSGESLIRQALHGKRYYFEDMEAKGGPKNTYVGELYFSAHRGVYTSQAAIKKGSRKAELSLREAEMWGVLAAAGFVYPLSRMDAAWKKLLLNQFHDILPGSSIAKVYEDARRDHKWIIGEAEAVKIGALTALTGGEGFSVFNSLSFPRAGLVKLPERFLSGAVTTDGEPVPVQQTAEGLMGLVTVPPCGAVCLIPSDANPKSKHIARACLTESGAVIENDFMKAVLNRLGEVVSFTDQTGREYAAGPLNRLLAYKDVPRIFDALDIDSNYIDQPVALEEKAELIIKEASGLRAVVHVSRRVMDSLWEQDIVLTAHQTRLDFVTAVNWRELHRLLKVEFPVNVTAAEGINEIQFGYLARPNHRSRLYDKDRFEVCNQRYSALCDQTHGAAVLNDCKYGISMNGNALQLSLLRAAASPEMRADNGLHAFTYAFTGWNGPFLDSPVVNQAYDLNVPLQRLEGGCAPFSAFSLDAANVFIDTVKPAEDGSGDVILRLYEAKRGDTACDLAVNLPVQAAYLCDMLENRLEALPVKGGRIALRFHPFEVKTVRLIPVQ